MTHIPNIETFINTITDIAHNETNIAIVYTIYSNLNTISPLIKLAAKSIEQHMLQLAIDNNDTDFLSLKHNTLRQISQPYTKNLNTLLATNTDQ